MIDSLKKRLEQVETSIEQARLQYKIALEYKYLDELKYNNYLNEIEKNIIHIKKRDTLVIMFLNEKGIFLSENNKFNQSDSVFNKSIKYILKNKFKASFNTILPKVYLALNNYYKGNLDESLIQFNELSINLINIDTTKAENKRITNFVNSNKAIVLARKGKLEEALIFFQKNVDFQEKRKSINNYSIVLDQINAYNKVALCLDMLQRPKQAINYYFKALKLLETYPIEEKVQKINCNLSNLFLNQFEFDKSIEYAKKGVGKNDKYSFSSYTNMGVSYMGKENHLESNKAFLNALELSEKLNQPYRKQLANINLSLNYLYLKKLDSTLYYLNNSEKLNKLYPNKDIEYKISNVKSKYFLETKNYNNAILYLLKNEKVLKEYENIGQDHFQSCENLYYSYKEIGDYKNSLFWLEERNIIQSKLDSLREVEEVNTLNEKYQTQQKENQILKLSKENIQKQAALTKSRFTTYAILGVLVLLLGIGYFYWHKRKKQYQLTLLENTVNTIEQEKSRIGRELHDGIAGSLIKLVHDTETAQIKLSHKLLQTYNEVRNLSHQLDNTPVHGELFLDRVLDIIPENKKNQEYHFDLSPRHLQLNEPHCTHIFRIIQELIANNLKHAKATKTSIELSFKENVLFLDYKDNGTGSINFKKGNGFKNIEDRITLMKGNLKINTIADKGFQLFTTIPYKNKV